MNYNICEHCFAQYPKSESESEAVKAERERVLDIVEGWFYNTLQEKEGRRLVQQLREGK